MIIKIEFLKKALDEAKGKILEDCIDELDLHGKDGTTIAGVKIQNVESGVKYDFTNCDEWNKFDKFVKEANEAKKDFENKLKGLKKPESILDEETGELTRLVPPARTSKTTVKMTFKK